MNRPATHPFSRTPRTRRGMVLFEVLVALTIFTLVAFSLVMALNSTFDASLERNDLDAAMRGLENQMSLLHENRLLPGDTALPDDGSGILYHVTVAQEQMLDQKNQPVPNMYRATVTATWKARGQTITRDVSELIYQP